MKKFLLGLASGVLLALLAILIVVAALARLGSRPPAVADSSTLVLKLSGEIAERAPTEIPLPFFESQSPFTTREVWEMLRKAAVDDRIKAVVLLPRSIDAGWGKLEEIRGALAAYRRSGKPLVAYLRSAGTREYYLATAADRIAMAPEDLLDVKGLRIERTYFRGTLDKLGVQVDIEHAGKYKDYGDQYARTSMRPESKEVLNSILDDLYGRMTQTLAESRKKSPAEMRATIDEGPFLSSEALAKGLVDSLEYEDQTYDALARRLKIQPLKRVSARDYTKVSAASLGLEGPHRIALIAAEGDILQASGGPFDEQAITPGGMTKTFREVAEDPSVKGVILRIDSPGGDALASDQIWREANLLGRKKPMVVSMSDLAASGGYYMAMTGDPVLAYPNTLTGSIGVLYGRVNLRGLYGKLGITKDSLARGRFAQIDSEYVPLTPEGREKIRRGVEANYHGFVTRVAESRHRKYEEIEPLAQGRVWLGSQARERGLVDELGGLDRAIELVKQKARIPKDQKIKLIDYPGKRTIVDWVLERERAAAIEPHLDVLLKQVHAALWMRGGLMRVMPYTITVR
ncbi:MAG: signal peptide peptidase SppA [Acidobacteriales bacterium]|nr:signal peptide peptidase SppA [Terriglobales bacterium]